MTSRLDRLVLLLDTGSTTSIRQTAARQLGALAKAAVRHPSASSASGAKGKGKEEVWKGSEGDWDGVVPLLARILPLIHSRSFETRQAASLALSEISTAVGVWIPAPPAGLDEVADPSSVDDIATEWRSLEALDITAILTAEGSSALLSSSGAEFKAKAPGGSKEDQAKAQKEALGKLGFGGMPGGAGDDLGIDLEQELKAGNEDTDVKMEEGSSRRASPQPAAAASGSKRKEAPSPEPELSARERNKLKRAKKTQAKAPVAAAVLAPVASTSAVVASTSSSAAGTPAPSTSEAVVIDPGAKARAGGAKAAADAAAAPLLATAPVGTWPWAPLVLKLREGILSSAWEVRHGSLLGLRAIMALQGESAGAVSLATTSKNEQQREKWTGDLAARVVELLTRDRFGDYASGEGVVAPVREVGAQVLALLLRTMKGTEQGGQVLRCLWELVDQGGIGPSRSLDDSGQRPVKTEGGRKYVWQVRHAGLVGLRYWVSVRWGKEDDIVAVKAEGNGHGKQDEQELDVVLKAAILGLQDGDEDVRSAAAASLSPVAGLVLEQRPAKITEILGVLWDALGAARDDLATSLGAVMDLLGKLLEFDAVCQRYQQQEQQQLRDLIPRLYPFARHTLASVRLAVVQTLKIFLRPQMRSSASAGDWVTVDLARLLIQNLVLEEKHDVQSATMDVWRVFLASSFNEAQATELATAVAQQVPLWFKMINQPVGVPFDKAIFWSPSAPSNSSGSTRTLSHQVDKPMLTQDLALVTVDSIMKARVATCTALGALMAAWAPLVAHQRVFDAPLREGIRSKAALSIMTAAIVIEEWAGEAKARGQMGDQPAATLIQLVQEQLAADPPSFSEIAPILSRLHTDAVAAYGALKTQGKVPADRVPALPATPSDFTAAQGKQVVGSFKALMGLIPKGVKKNTIASLEERYQRIVTGASYLESTKERYDRQVAAALAGAVVALGSLPAKITPVIRGLTSSIKSESVVLLQFRSARAIAALIAICSDPARDAKVNPTDKIVKNLCTFLCQDTTRTPIFAAQSKVLDEILTLKLMPVRGEAVKEDKAAAAANEIDAEAAKVVYRGAQRALTELAALLKGSMLERVPKLWSCMADALAVFATANGTAEADRKMAADPQAGQDLIDCLTVLPAGAEKLDPSLHPRLTSLFTQLGFASRSRFAVVRYAVAKAYAALCDVLPSAGLQAIVASVIPSIGDPLNLHHRQGAVEILYHLVELLDVKLLPYLILLIVPVLGRMSDSNEGVRLLATKTFATLIKLVPLEAGLPDPDDFPQELLARRDEERTFLTQLLDGSKVEEYTIPIPINAELRRYQRDGVSWLAFLAKYQLHGLLCDDMGLGKTLQSICILASKHHERAERYQATRSPDAVHLPSLVVCPPTLTGHWQQEILTYVGNLRPLVYAGAKAERDRVFSQIQKSDVVITSYDIVRNDVDALQGIDWHYCILDEGHIIKNSKTKLTKAVKSIKSIHRLILSGTPIQNNVLELWSLFDFLIPGFLGSEKLFNERFGRPIAASRDAKSSSKEQEAGALALEALHKQVLPFLMRRLKEDVLDDLPPKIIQDYYCELSPVQKALYEVFSASQVKQEVEDDIKGADTGAPPKAKQHVFQALQYLRKLVSHPSLVFQASNPDHMAGLAKAGQSIESVSDIASAPKLQALRQILVDCGIGLPDEESANDDGLSQHRVLIFCQLKQMLDVIETDLFKKLMPSVTYMRLDGTTDPMKRHAIVQTFNGDPSIDCLLLTTHVGGLGLNLTGADTVVFIEHDWNPMKDLQAMDRAHRLGQTKNVNVYRLITRGTLEEKIMGLQRFKLNIASSVVTQQNSSLDSLGTDQVLDLFSLSSASISAPAESKTSGKPSMGNSILSGLEDLEPDGEEQNDDYKDLDFTSFAAGL